MTTPAEPRRQRGLGALIGVLTALVVVLAGVVVWLVLRPAGGMQAEPVPTSSLSPAPSESPTEQASVPPTSPATTPPGTTPPTAAPPTSPAASQPPSTAASTPSSSAKPSATASATPKATPKPTPKPTKTASSKPEITSFKITPREVTCSTGGPGFPGLTEAKLKVTWKVKNAKEVHFGVDAAGGDAANSSYYGDLGASSTGLPDGFNYTCYDNHRYTLTVVGKDGSHVSKTLKVTNIGDHP